MPFLLAAIVVAGLVAELALTGRVIHQRREPDIGPAEQLGRLGDIRHRHLAAQMEEVIEAEQPVRSRGRDRPR
jgi:hypothetical protein